MHKVKLEILKLVKQRPQAIAPLEDGKLQMPFHSTDFRKRTWTKTASKLKLVNTPSDVVNDCWMVKANTPDGTHTIKLSKDGSKSKFKLHRVFAALLSDDAYTAASTRSSIHFAHRCGNGMGKDHCCVNPYHIKLVSAKANQDDKGCKYGCAQLCPHTPKCIWNWAETGLSKPCFNAPLLPSECKHAPKCVHTASVL